MDVVKWDLRYLKLAAEVAEWSKDPSTQVGAVITVNNRLASIGYNGFPEGVMDLVERLEDRETKYKLIQHAERNALDNVIVDVRGGTLYCTLKPCSECAKGLAQKGIARVVTYKSDKEDKYGWAFTDLIFREAGITLTEY